MEEKPEFKTKEDLVKYGLDFVNLCNREVLFPIEFIFSGSILVGNRNVYFPDTIWGTGGYKWGLPSFDKKAAILNIGSGTGCLAVGYYHKNQANIGRLVATDVNSHAVQNTKENFEKMKIEAEVIQSDMFENIPEGDKFDLIFWHSNFYYVPEDRVLSNAERGSADAGYKSLENFIANAQKYLTEEGRAMFFFSSDCGEMDILKEKAAKHGKTLVSYWENPEQKCLALKRSVKMEIYEVK